MNKQISNLEQKMYARLIEIKDGALCGNFIEMYNGRLHVLVSTDHGFDISSVHYRGINTSYLSRMGLGENSLPFSQRFEGGMLYTCGPDSIGIQQNYPQHGSWHIKKAVLLEKTVTAEKITVKAELNFAELFKPTLRVIRTLELMSDSGAIHLKDKFINDGFQNFSYALLYHFNFGYPFLNPQTDLSINSLTVKAADLIVSAAGYKSLSLPQDEAVEEVFYHEGNDGTVTLSSKAVGIKAILKYDTTIFPVLTQWKSMISGNYVLGIEPATSPMGAALSYNLLKSGSEFTADFQLEFSDI